MSAPRIASFLPAATEMVYVLGLGDALVGRSHECDFPHEALQKPVIVDSARNLAKLSAGEINEAVRQQWAAGQSLYVVDAAKLRAAAPELLVTQDLCQVCAPAGNEVADVIKSLAAPPKILWQTPRSFGQVLQAVRVLGQETNTLARAEDWVADALARVERVAAHARAQPKIRVAFIEWVDPLFGAGHWIPEMLEWAGGEDPNAHSAGHSAVISWQQVVDAEPEVIVVAPCGFKTAVAWQHAQQLRAQPGWRDLPAVQRGRVFAVDANAYFARPGPRLVDGVELLAHLIHPGEFGWAGPADAYAQLLESGA